MNRLIAALALGSAAAFAPAARAPASVVAFGGAGKYEGQIFGFPEKKDLWENWDPNSPRSETNFNPFERNADGNACDCSGYFPGEGKYSDPARPDVDFAAMMAEKTAPTRSRNELELDVVASTPPTQFHDGVVHAGHG